MHKMRGIQEKYSTVRIESPDEFEQQEIIKEFKKQNKSREDIIKELKSLNLNEPGIVKINTKAYKRDNRTITQIKILRDFKCQICQNTIKKKDGTYYSEAAHIEPKHRKGAESADKIVLLCPNHHKEFDLGELVIILQNKEAFHFILNGQEYLFH
jgi:predicted restriction endonuclease